MPASSSLSLPLYLFLSLFLSAGFVVPPAEERACVRRAFVRAYMCMLVCVRARGPRVLSHPRRRIEML